MRFPDPVSSGAAAPAIVGVKAPQFESDASGVIREIRENRPPVIVASPVGSLADLARCMANVSHERIDSQVRPSRSELVNPIEAALELCPALRQHVAPNFRYPGNPLITLSASGANGTSAKIVGSYVLEAVPTDSTRLVFELNASPLGSDESHVGLRNYFVARDGSIHVRLGYKARSTDPVVTE